MENLTMKLTNSTESFSEIKDWINPNGPKEKEKLKGPGGPSRIARFFTRLG